MSQIDRGTRRRADRHDRGYASGGGFLHEFKTCASTQNQDASRKRIRPEQGSSEEFIHRVVPSHVLTAEQNLSRPIG